MVATERVAYIVVGWNNENILPECFESILGQSWPNKIVYYVDNNSHDGSVEMVRRKFPQVRIIEPGSNTGFARGNNLALSSILEDATVSYVALVNSDARIDAQWTDRIVSFAKNKPRGACFQGITLDYYDHAVVDSTHIFVSRNSQATQANWRSLYNGELGPRKVFGVNAAACIVSRKFIDYQPFEELLDEDMFMYLEDVDLAARATVMGWDNYLVPGARAFHMGSASSGKNPGFSLYMTFRNNAAMLVKNFPWRIIIRLLPSLIASDVDTMNHYRRKRNWQAVRKILHGRLWGIMLSLKYIPKRRVLKSYRVISDDLLWSLMKTGD